MRRRGLSLTNGRCGVRRLRGENATRRPSNSRVLMAGVVCGEMEGEWRARSGRAARVARLLTEWLRGFRLCARRGAAGAQGASLVGLRLSAVCTIVVASSAVGFRCVAEVLCPMPFGLWPSGRAFAVEKGGEKCTVFRQKPRAFCRKWKPFAEKAGASCRKAQFGRAGRCFVGRGAPFIARRRGYR